MLKYFPLLLLIIIGCNSKKENLTETSQVALNNSIANDSTTIDTLEINQFADFYLVIPIKSKNYDLLNRNMFEIHHKYGIEIDTMGRYFDKVKQQIILPEDDEDEIYQGQYFPRRFDSNTLSIENAYAYEQDILEPKKFPTEMILVAGMFSNKKTADSLQKTLRKDFPKTIIQKSSIYIGCMH